MAGYEVVQHSETTSVTDLTVGVFSVEATCPVGKKVVGGGYSMSPTNTGRIVGTPSTRPTASGTGWVAEFEAPYFGQFTFTSYAICVVAG